MTACPTYPDATESLLGVLRWQDMTMPERVVCHRIVRDRRGIRAEPMTVHALVTRAGAAATHLRHAGVADGDRVVLAVSDPHDFLVAFIGALAIGASAVPLPPVAEAGAPRSFAARLRAVATDCAPSHAIVENAAEFARVLGGIPSGLGVSEPAAFAGHDPAPVTDRPGATPAFIQYTSGSTGAPKGVLVTHANVVANCRAIRDATNYTRTDRMVSWLPLHHDMGLVGGLLTSIYCAAETWLMPPLVFLGRPVTWLEAITAFRATLTVGPTFAYGLCARKIPDTQLAAVDLASLRLAYVGAEPVVPSVVRDFLGRFSVYGFAATALYPVYGLAEATLAVTFPRPGTPVREDRIDRKRLAAEGIAHPVAPEHPDGVAFISVGHALPGHRVTMRDPATGATLAERRVGELVVEGPSVTPRYFADPSGSPRTRLATGDLAYVADGHVYVVDRIKDLVIIAGRNYAPSDIEQAAADVAGVRRGRIVAFSSRESAGGEALHVVAEATPDCARPAGALAADVGQAIRREIGLVATSVTIVAAGSLERTSSGKVVRLATAEAHRTGTLVPFGDA